MTYQILKEIGTNAVISQVLNIHLTQAFIELRRMSLFNYFF